MSPLSWLLIDGVEFAVPRDTPPADVPRTEAGGA